MDDNQIVMWVLFTTLMLLLLVAGIFISIYMAGKRRLQQEVTITQMELTYEKELRKVETEVSEQMMEQFAQELHDNVGHILTCMRITIENKKLDEPEIEQAFLPIEGYLDEAGTHPCSIGPYTFHPKSANRTHIRNEFGSHPHVPNMAGLVFQTKPKRIQKIIMTQNNSSNDISHSPLIKDQYRPVSQSVLRSS